MAIVFFSLGSNQSKRVEQLNSAIKQIGIHIGKLVGVSDFFETKSWAYQDHDYLNCVIKIKTLYSPLNVLKKSKAIEMNSGRKSKTDIVNGKPEYTSRIIDIDILFYDQEIIQSDNLTIPHALLHQRKFVLKPLVQIAPDYLHPVLQEKIESLYKRCEDDSRVNIFKEVKLKDFN